MIQSSIIISAIIAATSAQASTIDPLDYGETSIIDALGRGCIGSIKGSLAVVEDGPLCVFDPCGVRLERITLDIVLGRVATDYEWGIAYSRVAELCSAEAINRGTMEPQSWGEILTADAEFPDVNEYFNDSSINDGNSILGNGEAIFGGGSVRGNISGNAGGDNNNIVTSHAQAIASGGGSAVANSYSGSSAGVFGGGSSIDLDVDVDVSVGGNDPSPVPLPASLPLLLGAFGLLLWRVKA